MMLRFQLDDIRRALPQYGEIGVGRADGKQADEYSAILYDRRRLTVQASGTFWFSDTPEVPGSTSFGNRIPRICTWARFLDTESRARFACFNQHWDHRSQPSRVRSAALLLQRIAGLGEHLPVLVTGDFNAGEHNPAFRSLVAPGTGLRDSFRRVHPHATGVGTFHGFGGRPGRNKIDAVLASSEWTVLRASILPVTGKAPFPSDHLPVTATLLLRPQRSPR